MIRKDLLRYYLRNANPAVMEITTCTFDAWAASRGSAVRQLYLQGEQRSYLSDKLILMPLAANLQVLHLDLSVGRGQQWESASGGQGWQSVSAYLQTDLRLLLSTVAVCTQLTELSFNLHNPHVWERYLGQPLSLRCLRSLTKLRKLICGIHWDLPNFDVPAQLPEHCPWLQALSCTPIRDNIRALSRLTGLQELDLQTRYDSTSNRWDLSCLNGLSALTQLHMDRVEHMPEAFQMRLPGLKVLNLWCCKLSNPAQLQNLGSLQDLIIQGGIFPSHNQFLPALSSLTSLSLSECTASPGSAFALPLAVSALTALRSLEAWQSDARCLPQVLAALTCLTRLVIRDRNTSRHSPTMLHTTLFTHLTALHELCLQFKSLHVIGSFQAMLAEMPQLVKLWVEVGPEWDSRW